MIGTWLGAYEILEELGSGGMGTVWKARDGEGTAVAIKTVHPHLLARHGFFKRFLREADVGASVRHDNVVSTLDKDALEIDGKTVLYLVMEFVEGRTLRALLDDLGTVPEALLREIAVQIAGGLAAIHELGYMHRDLKPENVLITEDQKVRIMDLGVARLVEESHALTQEGQFAGSLLYAAPEQLGAGEVGPSADLYALGVLLYELATGRNPFRRDVAAEVIQAHVNEVPRSVTEAGADVTLFLAEVTSCLLRKEPASRFESAALLHDVLAQGEAAAWWREREPALLEERSRRPRIPVRRVTAVYGRDAELEVLTSAWESAKAGEGRVVLLEGEAGIGKSRLVDTFLKTLEDEAVHVLYGSYPPSGGLGGLGGLSDAVLEHFGSADLEAALRPYLIETPRLVPTFAAMVKREAPPRDAEEVKGEALHAVFGHLLNGLAAEQPVVWIVEDLHFATKEGRDTVLAMTRWLRGRRVLLLATTRPGLPEDDVAHFTRLGHVERVGLSRLGAREVIQLLKDAFKSQALAEKLGGKIAFKSDGVPFFVFEMIRGLKEGQFIRESPDGSYVETQIIDQIEVPSAVRDLIQARLGDLSFEERNLLDAAAVWGFEIDSDLVARVCDLKRMYVLQRLAEIERRSGVVRTFGSSYRFDHHQIQEVIYESLSDELRAEYHGALAEALRKREGSPLPGEAAYQVAWHALRGPAPLGAQLFLIPAHEHLESGKRHGESLDLLTTAFRSGAFAGENELEHLLRLSQTLQTVGAGEGTREVIERAYELTRPLEDPVPLLRVRLQDAWDRGYRLQQWAEVEEEVSDCLALARANEEWRLALRAYSLLQYCAQLKLDHEQHLALARQRLALCHEHGLRDHLASAENSVGLALSRTGRFEEAARAFARSLESAAESGDRLGASTAQFNLAMFHMRAGRLEPLLEAHREQVETCRACGWTNAEVNAAQALGGTLMLLGDLDGGLAMREYALELAIRLGVPWMRNKMTLCVAEACAAGGDAARAQELFRDALSWIDSGSLPNRARRAAHLRVHGAWGLCLLEAEQRTGAIEHLTKAVRLGEELEAWETMVLDTAALASLQPKALPRALEILVRHRERQVAYNLMQAQYFLWRATGERERLEEAHRILLLHRDNAPEEYRQSIVQNVKMHRYIVDAWASLDPEPVEGEHGGP